MLDRLKAMTYEERKAEWDRKKPRKPLKRSPLKRSTKPLPKRNEKRIARKYAHYRKVIASPFHKQLRYQAYRRSGGYCECPVCVDARRVAVVRMAIDRTMVTGQKVELAFTEIPVWFERKGGEPWQRFRSTEGELHHRDYSRFGDENPDELNHVLWVWRDCHKRIEAEHGTRRRFLSGKR